MMLEVAVQINMYLNYYYIAEVIAPDDNLSISIVLCTENDSITDEYALGGCPTTSLLLYMSNKEQLIARVEAVGKVA